MIYNKQVDEKNVVFIPSKGRRNRYALLTTIFVTILTFLIADDRSVAFIVSGIMFVGFIYYLFIFHETIHRIELVEDKIKICYSRMFKEKIKIFDTTNTKIEIMKVTRGKGGQLMVLRIEDEIDKMDIVSNWSGWTLDELKNIKLKIEDYRQNLNIESPAG